jgi:polar amino acid transport system substrate-binding protein
MGIDAEYPPSTHLDESGNPAGLDVGSVTWIVQEEGFTVEFRLVTWNESIPALLGGDIDMIYSGMSITEERERQVNFSIPTGRSTSQWRYMVAVPGPFRIFWA